MKQLYFVPLDLRHLLKTLYEVREGLPNDISAMADAFEHNIKAVLDTISLPFEMASANAHNRHWQRISTAERIRAEIPEIQSDETPEEMEDRKNRIAAKNASDIMTEFLASDEGVDAISNDIAEFLLSARGRSGIFEASSELILQCTVLTWSLFEVFARDVFTAITNTNPKLVELLFQDRDIKKKFDFTKVPFDVLVEHGFDISKKMGTILVSQQDLSDLRTIKSIFICLYGRNTALCDSINSNTLWRLSQQRHLIVHKRGIVDFEYLKNTGDDLQCGSKLQVTPQQLEEYLVSVIDVVCSVLRAVKTENSVSPYNLDNSQAAAPQ